MSGNNKKISWVSSSQLFELGKLNWLLLLEVDKRLMVLMPLLPLQVCQPPRAVISRWGLVLPLASVEGTSQWLCTAQGHESLLAIPMKE